MRVSLFGGLIVLLCVACEEGATTNMATDVATETGGSTTGGGATSTTGGGATSTTGGGATSSATNGSSTPSATTGGSPSSPSSNRGGSTATGGVPSNGENPSSTGGATSLGGSAYTGGLLGTGGGFATGGSRGTEATAKGGVSSATGGSASTSKASTGGTSTGGTSTGGTSSNGASIGGASTGGASNATATSLTSASADPTYATSGPWHGYIWPAVDSGGVATVSPSAAVGFRSGGPPYCVTGHVPATSNSTAVAMIGMNTNQERSGGAVAAQWTSTGIGIRINVSNPGGSPLRLQIQTNETGAIATLWCSMIEEFDREVTVLWSDFNTRCWNGSGTSFDQSVGISTVMVLVPGTAQTGGYDFDFCVNEMTPI